MNSPAQSGKQNQNFVALSCENLFKPEAITIFVFYPAKPEQLMGFSAPLRLCAMLGFAFVFDRDAPFRGTQSLVPRARTL